MLETMMLTAMQVFYQAVPYKWGGDELLTGLDCSGFAQLVLRSVNLDPPGDQNSQMLFTHFHDKGFFLSKGVCRGNFLFFGKSETRISHIAVAVDEFSMVEMGGGTSQTVTREDARRDNAYCKISSISRRKDFVGAFNPFQNKSIMARV